MSESLKDIEREIMNCKKCELWKYRTKCVPGEGREDAEVFLIGEAPGKEEDRQGRPFVGNAGKLLNELLEIANLKRGDVFIGNVLKCRPPNNRDPKPEEVESCSPYLIRQLNVVKPKLIVCLGRYASSFVFDLFGLKFGGIGKERGKIRKVKAWNTVYILPTYHPAAALYKPQLKEVLVEDFRKIREVLKKDTLKKKTLLDFGIE